MPTGDRFNLGNGFSQYFRIDPALDDALRDETYRIRHGVYCEDLHFEPERPDRREIDSYDAHSVSCLLRTATEPHKPVGSTRIVLANPGAPDAPLPFELTCAATLDRSVVDPARLPRDRIAEISRLAVCRDYRKRKGEDRSAASVQESDFGPDIQSRFPYIPTSLLLGAVALAERSNIDTVFVLTEPRLATHFSRLGVQVTQIGEAIEHRGLRIPSMMHVDEIVRNMRSLIRPLWHIVRDQIREGYDAAEAAQCGDR